MSDALRDVLRDRSDDVPPFAFDVDTLVPQAESRRRRKLVVNAVGVVALVAAIVGAVAIGPGLVRDPEPVAPPARFAEPKLLYALGGVVHYGGESFDTGLEVNRGGLARTDYGFVLVQGKEVWFSDGTQKEKIGRIVDAHVSQSVFADALGTLVAWVGPDGDGHGEVVVYDSRLREVVARVGANLGDVTQLIAIDDGAVYWMGPGGQMDDLMLRYRVSTGEQTEVEGRAEAIAVDVAGGAVAYYAPESGPGRLTVDTRSSRSRVDSVFFPVDLSPDGSFVVASRKSGPAVFDAGTADEIALDLPKGFAVHQFMGWVDGNTSAFWDAYRRAVLVCEARTGSCVVALRDPGDVAAVWFPQFPGYHPG